MTTQTFILVFIGFCLFGGILFLIGQYVGFQLGFGQGWEGGIDCAVKSADIRDDGNDETLADIRWQLAAPLPGYPDPSDRSDGPDIPGPADLYSNPL